MTPELASKTTFLRPPATAPIIWFYMGEGVQRTNKPFSKKDLTQKYEKKVTGFDPIGSYMSRRRDGDIPISASTYMIKSRHFSHIFGLNLS